MRNRVTKSVISAALILENPYKCSHLLTNYGSFFPLSLPVRLLSLLCPCLGPHLPPDATPKVLLIEIANISSLSPQVNILPDLTFPGALAISKRLSHVI